MWDFINKNTQKYAKISLAEERHLITRAQNGSAKSKNELILRHIGFLIGRIHRIVFHDCQKRFGEVLFSEGILIINAKIRDYDLAYCNKQGKPTPVRFKSYIWKRIDGFIIDYLKKEMIYSEYFENYEYN